MKKISRLTAIILALMIIASVVFSVSAETEENTGSFNENVTYSFDADAGILTISGTGDVELSISEGNYPWYPFKTSTRKVVIEEGITKIGRSMFNGFKNLKIVQIPSGVKSIGEFAFNDTALSEVALPEGVEFIGGHAFWQIQNLKKVTLPESLTEVGDYAFAICREVSEFIIPKNLTKIGNAAFSGGDSIKTISVDKDNPVYDSRDNCNGIVETASNTLIAACNSTVIPESVTKLSYAYWDLRSLTSVNIPSSVTEIGDSTFDGCSGLTKIDIPDSVTVIGKEAFAYCDRLEKIEFPDSVTSLGSQMFWDCDNLKEVKLPSGLKTIPPGFFTACTSLEDIVIPESVVNIGNYAMQSCSSIKKITIPKNVENIGKGIFANCSNLTELTVDKENKVFDSRNNCNAIMETNTNALIAVCPVTVIPEETTVIGEGAFQSQQGLKYVELPESVSAIEDSAFSNCKKLETIVITKNVKRIRNFAFNSCDGLKHILYTGTQSEWETLISNTKYNTALSKAEVVFEYDPSHTHTDGEIVVDSEATCTNSGSQTVYCSYCYKGIRTEEIPALGHIEGSSEITKDSTCTETGVKITYCSRCGEVMLTEEIPALGHNFESGERYCTRGCGTENPNFSTEPATTEPATAPAATEGAVNSLDKGTTAALVDKYLKKLTNDKDPEGSNFGVLSAGQKKVTKTAITIKWNKVKGAKTYVVYGAKCGKTNGKFNVYKKIKTVKATSFTQKKLKKGIYYKYLVVAFDKNNKLLSTSKTLHIATKGGKVGNSKSVTVTPKSIKLSVKKSKTVKATAKAASKKLKVKNHRKISFESSDKKIASVNSKGKVTAKKKGTCYIFAYAQNGVFKKIKVTVK